MIKLLRTNSQNADFQTLILSLDQDLRDRNGEVQQAYDEYNKVENLDTVVIAYSDNVPAGCGCFKALEENGVTELKRMFVSADYRGKGISKAILTELENWSKDLGNSSMVLETGTRQIEAQQLYQRAGYELIPNYAQYADMEDSICMKKMIK